MTADDFDYSITRLRFVRDTAANLKTGDVVELNWHHKLRIENRDFKEDSIEYMGELQRNNEWRFLTVETNRLTPPRLTTPERTNSIAVVDIQPVEETILTSQTAAVSMKTDVSVDHAYRARRVEVSKEAGQKVGECPVCGGWMWQDNGRVGCRDCGVWAEEDVYKYWADRSEYVEYDPGAYDEVDAGDQTLEYWVHDKD